MLAPVTDALVPVRVVWSDPLVRDMRETSVAPLCSHPKPSPKQGLPVFLGFQWGQCFPKLCMQIRLTFFHRQQIIRTTVRSLRTHFPLRQQTVHLHYRAFKGSRRPGQNGKGRFRFCAFSLDPRIGSYFLWVPSPSCSWTGSSGSGRESRAFCRSANTISFFSVRYCRHFLRTSFT